MRPMPRARRPLRLVLVLLAVLTLLAIIGAWAFTRFGYRPPRYVSTVASDLIFERVSEPGLDADGRSRLADSAWSMRYFRADDADQGYLYVGTDNNILGLSLAALRARRHPAQTLPVQPPQIRRYRPDIGPEEWEVVLDCADHESAPYHEQGFRSMAVYRARSDGVTYLYAGTMAASAPSLWRSVTGDAGTWEQVHVFEGDGPPVGSVRGLTPHADGLLYLSTTAPGDIAPGGVGQVWVTDGASVTRVVDDGFGDPSNAAVTSLSSYQGCLYAGTFNAQSGFQIWKLRCIDAPEARPEPVIMDGGNQPRNEAVMTMHVFREYLYVGTGIPLGHNPYTRHGPRGAALLRIAPDDTWQVVVGERDAAPLSGYRAGFGWRLNVYNWYLAEHDGYLYLGTWDFSRTIKWLGERAESVASPFRPLLRYLVTSPQGWESPMGGDLYRSPDGVYWEPVFLDGLGNPDNHGIRTLVSTPMGLFVGTENPFTRLEIWRMVESP